STTVLPRTFIGKSRNPSSTIRPSCWSYCSARKTATRDRLGRRSKWYFGRKKGVETEAPAATAALPIRKSRRVRLTDLLQGWLMHARDRARGKQAQVCWCPRCRRDREEQAAHCATK